MLINWVVVLFVLAIIAGALGFFGLSADLAFAAKILFFIFVALLILSLLSKALRYDREIELVGASLHQNSHLLYRYRRTELRGTPVFACRCSTHK